MKTVDLSIYSSDALQTMLDATQERAELLDAAGASPRAAQLRQEAKTYQEELERRATAQTSMDKTRWAEDARAALEAIRPKVERMEAHYSEVLQQIEAKDARMRELEDAVREYEATAEALEGLTRYRYMVMGGTGDHDRVAAVLAAFLERRVTPTNMEIRAALEELERRLTGISS